MSREIRGTIVAALAQLLISTSAGAQSFRPPNPAESGLLDAAAAFLDCLALRGCDPSWSTRFALGATVVSAAPMVVGESHGDAHTAPDHTNGSGDLVYTPDLDNLIVLNENNFCYNPDGSAQFMSRASESVSLVDGGGSPP